MIGRLAIAVMLTLSVPSLLAQVGDTITLGASCSYLGERLPSSVTMFSSNSEAESAIKKITGAAGLTANFDVQAAGVPNAAAIVRGDRRVILYNPFFMTETRQKTMNNWAPLVILAHEIGHHLQGHTLTRSGSSPKIELEADQYSGFILQKLGASLLDAKSALEALPDAGASETHPAKTDRLAAIGSGWFKACDPKCPGSTTDEPSASRPQTSGFPTSDSSSATRSQPRTTPSRGANSCEYANDGECDEPVLCETGTDTNDCRAARRSTTTAPRVASVCATLVGTCPMMVPLSPGSECTCFTIYGPIPGIAR